MKKLVTALAACSLLLTACGDDDAEVATDVGQDVDDTSTTTAPETTTTEVTMPVDLVADVPDELAAGPVELRFEAVNVSDEPITLTFPSGQEGDAQLFAGDGGGIYTWSATRSFIQMLQERTLAPGESIPVVLEADLGDVAPGTYTLELSLAVQDPPPPVRQQVTVGG